MCFYIVCSMTTAPSAKKERTSTFWETDVLQNFGETEWYLNFRMPEEAFLNLCDLLHPYIPKQTMKTTVSLEKRVALTLYKLASNTEFHDVANLFGIGVSTACDVFWEVCKGLCQLKRKFIGMPKSEEDVKTIIKGFQEKSGFPMCAGALDGTHIPILAPSSFHTDYYNRKGWYSVILQGLVDHQYMFQDFDVGWPGKCHDSFVFQNSKLHAKLENGTCFPPLTKTIQGVDIPVLIVADSAYSLSRNVMKPFPEGVARGPQLQFNACLSRARIHVEHAFGRLKGRWRCLMKRNDSQTTNIKFVVAACIVLHNFCESWKLDFPQEQSRAEMPEEEDTEQEHADDEDTLITPEPLDLASSTAEQIREVLVWYISENQ